MISNIIKLSELLLEFLSKLLMMEKLWALSIQQKKPVQDFGIFAGQMERVPELVNHVRRLTVNPGHANDIF